MIFQGSAYVGKSGAMVDCLNLDSAAASRRMLNPAYKQITAPTAILQNVATQLGCDSCNKSDIGWLKDAQSLAFD